MASVEQIKSSLSASAELSPILEMNCIDVTGGGCEGGKFELYLVTDKVEGVSLLDRQLLVHSALGPLMSKLHALSMKVLTSKQHQARLAKEAAAASGQ
jgi:acid stress-induced BolA-like protein IbaG/YrbA